MFQRIEPAPAYRTVFDAIERQIMTGRLEPGDLLPTEASLAKQFGLARHTVREGLRILEESGLVGRKAGRRLFVRTPPYSDFAPRASRTLIMQRVTFEELWEVSMALEPCAAARAALHVTDAQIDRLEDNCGRMEKQLAARNSVVELDVEFHTLIAEIASNKALQLAREPISLLLYPALAKLFAHPLNCETGPRRLAQAHRYIVDALKARDSAKAELWMRRHIVDFRRGYELCGFDLREAIVFAPAST